MTTDALLLPIAWPGRVFLRLLGRLGRHGRFLGAALTGTLSGGFRGRDVVYQLRAIGAGSVPVIMLAGAFVGMVVALQFHDTLVRFGSVSLIGSAVGLSLIRELGPVITALMVIGRSGSAMCAELAVMRTEQQMDALTCMAIDPLPFLVTPRFIATLVAVPLLTAIMVSVGILGGWFIAHVMFGIGTGTYLEGMAETVNQRDLVMGLTKSLVFALVIVWITTARGFLVHLDRRGRRGAAGISAVTTEAVVYAAVAVLFSDYLVSAILL